MSVEVFLPVRDYSLEKTLTSGQAFRWELREGWWEGVIGRRWVRLQQGEGGLAAQAMEEAGDWVWLNEYLQVEVDLMSVLASFPKDEPMQASVEACRGLRLLRQEPWECLASFILSSTKQIVQIRQIVALLCERYGEPVQVPAGHKAEWSFPRAESLAEVPEVELRACKMGFRAPNLVKTARMVAGGELDLDAVRGMPLEQAREELVKLPGVGNKVANCVLLFAYGYDPAFPVDVWILKALRQLYFPRRRPSLKRLRRFTETHFGPHAGYAQQYLFHYMRLKR